MKFGVLKYLSLVFLTSCFYGKVRLTPADKTLIPYNKPFSLILKNTRGLTDTLTFNKELIRSSNLDFFIEKRLYGTNDKKRPYVESYSTNIDLEKTIYKTTAKEPWIKYNPMIFSFCKYQKDPKVTLYYNIDGRWNGNISFDTMKTVSLIMDDSTLNDVVLIENTKVALFGIRKLYWSLEHGLVRIDEKNGDNWTVITKFD